MKKETISLIISYVYLIKAIFNILEKIELTYLTLFDHKNKTVTSKRTIHDNLAFHF